jgi:acetolactate synthase-1/2/3 large subunit
VLQAATDLGADYIFSSAGSEWAPVWEALARRDAADEAAAAGGAGASGGHSASGGHGASDGHSAGPRYLDLTHETLAVAMATGYAVATGRGQVVLLHAAAGLLQGANAIHGALLTGAPMVVCSGESTGYGDAAGPDPGSQWYRNLSVVGGPQAIAAPFTKWANAAADVSVLYGMIKRGGELAAQAPAGPVYVNTPVEVLLAPWRPAATGPVPATRVNGTMAVPENIETAVRLLAAAQRPVLVTETAGRDAETFAALVELAGLLAIPVVEPQSAVSSSFPRSSPLHAGGELGPLAADADLVVLLGCRSPWYPPSARQGNATVLVIDEVPHRPHMAYQVLTADHYVGGAAAPTLRAITAGLRAHGIDEEVVAARRNRVTASHGAADAARRDAESKALSAAGGPVDPAAVGATLRELIGDDAVVIDETITHSRTLTRHLMADTPGRYAYVQGGLGQGLGVALGTRLAVGDRLTVLTVGDGTWLYNPVPQALMASAQYGLPLLVVIFNNNKYLSMRFNLTRAYPEGTYVTRKSGYGVDLSAQPDAAAVAAAAGAAGFTVTSTPELAPTLEKAIAAVRAGQTAVVNVHLTR